MTSLRPKTITINLASSLSTIPNNSELVTTSATTNAAPTVQTHHQPDAKIMNVDIDSQDMIKLILQFLKENSLISSMYSLQKETGVVLNTVDNIDSFQNDIRQGKWDFVLNQLSTLKLPVQKLTNIYEQIFLELLENGERDLARELLHTIEPLTRLKTLNPEKYMKLGMLGKRPYFNASDAYDLGTNKQSRRDEIASELAVEVTSVEPSRLLSLMGKALKYQQIEAMINLPVTAATSDAQQEENGSRATIPTVKQLLSSLLQVPTNPSSSGDNNIDKYDLFHGRDKSLAALVRSKSLGLGSGIDSLGDERKADKLLTSITPTSYHSSGGVMVGPHAVKYQSFLFNLYGRGGDSSASTGSVNKGDEMVVGKNNGVMEVYDIIVSHGSASTKIELNQHLEYQQPPFHNLMNNVTDGSLNPLDDCVLCGCYSKDGNHIAVGLQSGTIRIWRISTGRCIKVFLNAHKSAVTSVEFAKDGLSILSASYDSTIRVHGLKTGKVLKEFRGHTSFVNTALFSRDNSYVISGSADGTVRIFDAKTVECLHTIRPAGNAKELIEVAVHSVRAIPTPSSATTTTTSSLDTELYLALLRSNQAVAINLKGETVKVYSPPGMHRADDFAATGGVGSAKKSNNLRVSGNDFVAATFSAQGKWLYCAGEDRNLYIFDTKTTELEATVYVEKALNSDIIDILHHPTRSIVAVLLRDGTIRFLTD